MQIWSCIPNLHKTLYLITASQWGQLHNSNMTLRSYFASHTILIAYKSRMPDSLQHQVLFQASLHLLPPAMRNDVARQQDEGDEQA